MQAHLALYVTESAEARGQVRKKGIETSPRQLSTNVHRLSHGLQRPLTLTHLSQPITKVIETCSQGGKKSIRVTPRQPSVDCHRLLSGVQRPLSLAHLALHGSEVVETHSQGRKKGLGVATSQFSVNLHRLLHGPQRPLSLTRLALLYAEVVEAHGQVRKKSLGVATRSLSEKPPRSRSPLGLTRQQILHMDGGFWLKLGGEPREDAAQAVPPVGGPPQRAAPGSRAGGGPLLGPHRDFGHGKNGRNPSRNCPKSTELNCLSSPGHTSHMNQHERGEALPQSDTTLFVRGHIQ
jgi:hypothetical protein